jgi:hypothetical protein
MPVEQCNDHTDNTDNTEHTDNLNRIRYILRIDAEGHIMYLHDDGEFYDDPP